MLPFGVTIPATVPQGSEIPEGLTNNPVYVSQRYLNLIDMKISCFYPKAYRYSRRLSMCYEMGNMLRRICLGC